MPKEVTVVFHSGSAYDYHFKINLPAKEFKGRLESLGENTKKYITFSVPINKELDNVKTIKCKLKFIDSFRFMSAPISSLVDNLLEIYKKNAKDARKIEKSSQYTILLGLKMINLIINVKNVKKDVLNQ